MRAPIIQNLCRTIAKREKTPGEDLLGARVQGSSLRFYAFLVAKLGVLPLVTIAIGAAVRLPLANRFYRSLVQV